MVRVGVRAVVWHTNKTDTGSRKDSACRLLQSSSRARREDDPGQKSYAHLSRAGLGRSDSQVETDA